MDLEFDPSRPAAGTFLVASPQLLDPNFMHTVVLLCDHGPLGSYGMVVNRPDDRSLSDLGVETPLLAGRSDQVWYGGPVKADLLQVLHRMGSTIPGSHTVAPGIHLGGDPAVLRTALDAEPGAEGRVRFVRGYSGWGEGQLEAELAERAWVVCPADQRFVFDSQPDTLWRRVLRAKGGAYARLADLPPDPTWN